MSTLRVDNIVPYTSGSTTIVLSGTLETTASYALTASYAMNGGGGGSTGLDTTASGDYSHAEGRYTLASGDFSHAEGNRTIASNNYAHAEGRYTTASRWQSHAEGNRTHAGGISSHAEGDRTIALGEGSHAEGYNTIASGLWSHAEGDATQAIGNLSHAEGAFTQAIGVSSHTEGESTKTGITTAFSASIVSGVITLSGSYGDVAGQFAAENRLYLYDLDNNNNRRAHIISQSYFDSTNTIVELYDTGVNATTAYVGNLNWLSSNGSWNGDQTIPGDYSHAEGNNTTVLGLNSHAEGRYTIAAGDFAHAEGNRTQALNDYSHAEGRLTVASRWQSHAEGNRTHAGGISSHAEGDRTVTLGEGSHAEGYQTIASGSYQHVSGQYNQHNNTGSYFVVGIGLDDNTRKDGFTVDVDANGSGSVMIPTNEIAGASGFPTNPKIGSLFVDPVNNVLYIYTDNGPNGWGRITIGYPS